jgi:hypothetical protein
MRRRRQRQPAGVVIEEHCCPDAVTGGEERPALIPQNEREVADQALGESGPQAW